MTSTNVDKLAKLKLRFISCNQFKSCLRSSASAFNYGSTTELSEELKRTEDRQQPALLNAFRFVGLKPTSPGCGRK